MTEAIETGRPDPAAILGVILAGGGSRRMGGGDKCLLPLAGRPLLQSVIDRLEPQVGRLVLNANGDASRFSHFGLAVIADTLPDQPGPLAGFLAGLRHAETLNAAGNRPITHVLTAAADTPFLPADLAHRLAEAIEQNGAEIAIATSFGRTHPVVALVPAGLAEGLEAHLAAGGRRNVDAWLLQYRTVEVDFSGEPDPFFNVNAPEDLAEAEAIVTAG